MEHLKQALQDLESALKKTIEAAYLDDKTPLQNAMAMREVASFLEGSPSPFVVAFGDLNRFKSINDNFGHDAGDLVITEAGKILHEHIVQPLQGNGFRVSGDEFTLLLRPEQIEDFQQLCLEHFQNASLRYQNDEIPFSMSFGLAASNENAAEAEERPSFALLYQRAEQACILAKQQGNGQALRWVEEMEAEVFINRRIRCDSCHTTTSCSIPENRWHDGLPLPCPVCQTPLRSLTSSSHSSSR
jgi:diguanylate cyclase (GGDEF)-like protein